MHFVSLLNLLKPCARFLTLKSSQMGSIMKTKKVKTSLEDQVQNPESIMSQSLRNFLADIKSSHLLSFSHKYNSI